MNAEILRQFFALQYLNILIRHWGYEFDFAPCVFFMLFIGTGLSFGRSPTQGVIQNEEFNRNLYTVS
jgi:hypothetical protein